MSARPPTATRPILWTVSWKSPMPDGSTAVLAFLELGLALKPESAGTSSSPCTSHHLNGFKLDSRT
eukprot:2579393-Lingulodinium_polyedra.AAC.1